MIPDGANSDSCIYSYTIFIAPGMYVEDLLLCGEDKRISLIGLGPITLIGQISWAVIPLNNRKTNFSISCLPQNIEDIHDDESGSTFQIYGPITIAQPCSFRFNGELFGELKSLSSAATVDLYISKSKIHGQIKGGHSMVLQVAEYSRFDGVEDSPCFYEENGSYPGSESGSSGYKYGYGYYGYGYGSSGNGYGGQSNPLPAHKYAISVRTYGYIVGCDIRGGMEIWSAPNPIENPARTSNAAPVGIYMSQLRGKFKSHAKSTPSYFVDVNTQFWSSPPRCPSHYVQWEPLNSKMIMR
jgi:hypothetical protein